MYISIIICTTGDRISINETVNSIYKNSYTNFELILICQTKKNNLIIKNIITPKEKILRKYFLSKKGLSYARNFAIKIAKGQVIAFTDDDCIVDKEWLQNIKNSFKQNLNAAAIFGKVLPFKPLTNKGKLFPSIINTNKFQIYKKPIKHWLYIGFGNNMSIKKNIFLKYGIFNTLLGAGSYGLSTEDGEFAIRLLTHKEEVIYNPNILIYHNRPLDLKEYNKLNLKYICGEVACYTYYAISGLKLGKDVVIENLRESYHLIKRNLKYVLIGKRTGFYLLYMSTLELTYKLYGIMIGIILYLRKFRLLTN